MQETQTNFNVYVNLHEYGLLLASIAHVKCPSLSLEAGKCALQESVGGSLKRLLSSYLT